MAKKTRKLLSIVVLQSPILLLLFLLFLSEVACLEESTYKTTMSHRVALVRASTAFVTRSAPKTATTLTKPSLVLHRCSPPVVRTTRQQPTRSYSVSPCRNMVSGEEMMLHLSNGNRKKLEGNDIPLAMEALLQAECVCFDVDSTVVNEEGIDVLADFLGQGEAVAALTKQAMEGGMKFQDALSMRLELLKPSLQDIKACLEEHPLKLTPGVLEFVDKLHDANKFVFLVSGGFRIMIEPVAEILQIPQANIIANTILFDAATGEYAGFDTNEPTSQDMGKPKALQLIQDKCGYQTMVMIGDGATDAQAKPPAKAFLGFGGVVVREKVKAASDWFVTDFADLSRLLDEFPCTSPASSQGSWF